jgi:hypothetical protein
MRSSRFLVLGIGGGVIFTAFALISTSVATEDSTRAPSKTSGRRVEEIYIARSFRESREVPTEFCSKSRTGFDDAVSEDHFTFRSISINASDGKMIDNNVRTIGRLRACFGSTNDSKLQNFYAEGSLGAVTFTGKGECLANKADYPEAGITGIRCFLHLSDLPTEYVGGELTTNSIRSRNVLGGVSDPPGYTQPSIATIRLWKRSTES